MNRPMDSLIAPERLATDRCVIRSWREGDGPALSAAVVPSYEHLRTFMPWARPDQDAAQSEVFVRHARGRYLLGTDFTLGIFDLDEAAVLGGTGFHLRHGPLEVGVAEIGMWISSGAAGTGLGTHVLVAMLQWGFRAWPWERLVWGCDARNVASARVAEKAGMQLEGRWRSDRIRHTDGSRRDSLWFAALRAEWQPPG